MALLRQTAPDQLTWASYACATRLQTIYGNVPTQLATQNALRLVELAQLDPQARPREQPWQQRKQQEQSQCLQQQEHPL
jgi:hypothetical protein